MTKKTDDIHRDNVYMDMAVNASRLSKDEDTNIGCIIIANDKTPVSWGYNGAISGWNDILIPHSRENKSVLYKRIYDGNEEIIDVDINKYPFMSHAEANAIYFADREKLEGSTLYVTAYPCEECAKAIARAKIKRVVVRTPETIDSTSSIKPVNYVSECILAQSNITLTVDGKDIQLKPVNESESTNKIKKVWKKLSLICKSLMSSDRVL